MLHCDCSSILCIFIARKHADNAGQALSHSNFFLFSFFCFLFFVFLRISLFGQLTTYLKKNKTKKGRCFFEDHFHQWDLFIYFIFKNWKIKY